MIFVSEATLLPVVVPAAPAKTIVPRFAHQLGMVLRELGVDEASSAIETASMNTVTWEKTSNRSVLHSTSTQLTSTQPTCNHPDRCTAGDEALRPDGS